MTSESKESATHGTARLRKVKDRAGTLKHRTPTMKDVAAAAGVSVQTVSNFVRGKTDQMSMDTASTIQTAIRRVEYPVGSNGREGQSGGTRSLAFLLLDDDVACVADPMTALVLSGVCDVARERRYQLSIVLDSPHANADRLMEPIRKLNVDGAILFLSGSASNRQHFIREADSCGFPVVTFEATRDTKNIMSVVADNRGGSRLITDYLVANGHSRIAFIGTDTSWPMLEERLAGYQEGLAGAGLEINPELVVLSGVWDATNGAVAAHRLLALKEPPTAIVAANDVLAVGALRAALDRNLRVPEQLSVVGFNDFSFSSYTSPTLTTVRTKGYEVGRTAADLLINRIEGSISSRQNVTLPTELCFRNSAGRWPPRAT